MTYKPHWPKKKDRQPPKGTTAYQIYAAHQEKLLQKEVDEPLSDFDLAAIASRLKRKS